MDIKEAVILAGGKGTRLRSVTMNKIPKGLTEIQGKPILEWELEWLAREGVNHVVLAIGHLADKIEAHFDGTYEGEHGTIDIDISVEHDKLGSGGAFKQASEKLTGDRTYVLNGDVLCNTSLTRMKQIHARTEAKATMLLVNMTSPYGIVKRDNYMITSFVEKPLLDVQIHAGLDIIEQEVFKMFPTKGQMEDTVFVQLANKNKFASYLISNDDFWMSVDTEKDFKKANDLWTGLD